MDKFISVKQAAEKWELSVRSVQSLCANGRIEGAMKISNVWVIPEDAQLPADGRIKTGKYVNWRNNDKV